MDTKTELKLARTLIGTKSFKEAGKHCKVKYYFTFTKKVDKPNSILLCLFLCEKRKAELNFDFIGVIY